MGDRLRTLLRRYEAEDLLRMETHLRIILKRDHRTRLTDVRLITQHLLMKIEVMLQHDAGIMQTLQKCHALPKLHRIPVVCIARPMIVAGDLITVLRIEVHKLLGDAELRHCLVHLALVETIDQLLCARSRDTTDVVLSTVLRRCLRCIQHRKVPGLVRHPGLQAADVHDTGLRDAEDPGHELHRFGAGMIDILLIELPKLLEIFELIDLPLRLLIDIDRRQQLQIPNQYILPVELLRAGHPVVTLDERQKLFRKLLRKVHRPIHAPLITATDPHIPDRTVSCGLDRPFPGLPLHEARRIPGIRLIAMVHILPHPVIGGQNIAVVPPEHRRRMVHRRQCVLRRIFRIVDQLHLVLIDEVLELLLQVPDHDRDIRDPHLMKLSDLTLDHPLPENLEQALRCLIRERHETGAEARRQYERRVHPMGLQVLLPCLRQFIQHIPATPLIMAQLSEKPLIHRLLQELIRLPQRHSQRPRQVPLRTLRTLI